MLVLALACALTGAPPAPAELVSRLRVEVDELAAELRDHRARTRDELAALRAERTELQRQLRLVQVRQQTLQTLAAERQAQAEGLEGKADSWRQPILQMVASAKVYVQEGLPYQQAARLETLENIGARLDQVQPDYAAVLGRLWRFVEEEKALAQTMGRSQQAVTIEGEALLADVIHLAMGALYLRAPDGRFAWAAQQDAGWTLTWVKEPAAQQAVAKLFAAFEDNRVVGRHRILVSEQTR